MGANAVTVASSPPPPHTFSTDNDSGMGGVSGYGYRY
jgi:hypothetical protein